MKEVHQLRVVTYNIHKCRGLDRRVRPDRIVTVLREIDADIIALQEVVGSSAQSPVDDQAHYIARELGVDYRFGENRQLNGAGYGNVVLSRLPILFEQNYDLSQRGYEERGCLRADIELDRERVMHVYNVHLGTSLLERRNQGRRLLDEEILNVAGLPGPRLLVGDFNEWTRGLTSQLLNDHFQCADIRLHLNRKRTYPGVFPFLHLDHIYFDNAMELVSASLHRSRTALIASDHLPIVAEFKLRQ